MQQLKLTFSDAESAHVPSEDSAVLHVEASHPENIITKAQTASYTKHVAHILRHQYQIGASGPGKDVVVCISSGQVLLPTIFYGTIAAGGIYSAASSSLTTSELKRQIEDGKATLLITSPDCFKTAKEAAHQVRFPLERIITLDSTKGKRSLFSHKGKELLSQPTKELPWEKITDPCVLAKRTICLVYSSGTTGAPKGRDMKWSIRSTMPGADLS